MGTFLKFARKLTGVLAVVAVSAVTSGTALAQETNNWVNPYGDAWKNGTNELCWRNAFWTPATGIAGCDGVPPPAPTIFVATPPPALEAPPQIPAITPQVAPPLTVTPPPVVQTPPPVPLARVVLNANTFFDYDKSTLKPEGQRVLDQVVEQVNQLHELEGLIVVGHTDHVGTHAYNQALSERRAESVTAYLVNKGIAAENIQTEGKGKTMPIASNATREGRAQNRRVEIEIIGTREANN